MRSKWVFALLLAGVAAAGRSADPPQLQRKSLDQATVIQGYPCAKGYAWLYRDGRLNRCTITRDLSFGEAWIPAGSLIELRPDGSTLYALMSRAAPVAAVRCSGGGYLGPSEGSVTEFYPSGKFKLCFLDGDQTVLGVPCASGGFWHAAFGHELPVEFCEDGGLKSCGLAADFAGKHRGDKFIVAESR